MRAKPLALAAIVCSLAAWSGRSETRPRYGGVLRVELRALYDTSDPPASGPLTNLAPAFRLTTWEGGRRAIFAADDSAPAGRPFADSVEVQFNRSLRDQSIDFELGKADIIELGPAELRRLPAGRKVWTSSPVRILALVFSPRVDDPRTREALALAVDRNAIHTVLLQRQGEPSAALLPQWLSGYAFAFHAAADLARARSLSSGARPLTLSVAEPSLRAIADRIALNARDAGLTLTVTPQPTADVRLFEARVASGDPAKALALLASAFGLPDPARADTPEALYQSERALLEGFRVIPLFHLPDVYAVSQRVKGGPGITPLGEWRFGDLWIDTTRP